MVRFEKFTLANGLRVILHRDPATPIAAVNVAYDVGSRDEDPEHTGFAHLFEHLMFGGSQHIPVFDTPLQEAGGENNAFTNTDFTDYYMTVPLANVETALWLESDRMNGLAFSGQSLEVQRKVVMEEFKQSYLNQPYGDVMLLLKPLAYQVHPYRWNPIGMELRHIAEATMEQVKDFFYRFYRPNRAVLTIAGAFDMERMRGLVEKWFGDIPSGETFVRTLPKEPLQTAPRFESVERQVPCDLLVKAYHGCRRAEMEYYPTDMLTDILSNGKSARLQRHLVLEKQLFSNVSAYVTGTFDEGLLILSGNPAEGVSLESADEALQEELDLLCRVPVGEEELRKTKNQIGTLLSYADLQVQDKAMNLSIFELMEKAERYNTEEEFYRMVSAEALQETARKLFKADNCSTLYYKAVAATPASCGTCP